MFLEEKVSQLQKQVSNSTRREMRSKVKLAEFSKLVKENN